MYNALKMEISLGNFKLQDMQSRLKKLYALGAVTDSQLDDLLNLTMEKVTPEMERPEMNIMLQNIINMLSDLDSRLSLLEGNASIGTDGDNVGEYPAWEPWDGLSNQYQPGTIVRHKEQLWKSTFQGQNVWEPGTVGSQFWTQYPPET